MFFLEKMHKIEYTKRKKSEKLPKPLSGREKTDNCLECARDCNFEPTFTFMGFLYPWSDVRPPSVVEGRRPGAVTHLALLGVKIARYGILGI